MQDFFHQQYHSWFAFLFPFHVAFAKLSQAPEHLLNPIFAFARGHLACNLDAQNLHRKPCLRKICNLKSWNLTLPCHFMSFAECSPCIFWPENAMSNRSTCQSHLKKIQVPQTSQNHTQPLSTQHKRKALITSRLFPKWCETTPHSPHQVCKHEDTELCARGV